jgi:hypothetical protein
MRGIASAALVLMLCAVLAHAVVPRTVSYQGVLKDDEGVVVPDDTYSIEFNIYDVQTGGTALWTETQSVDVSGGIFNVTLGELVYLGLPFDETYWLGVTVESDPELPRTELTAAPYAFRAAIADSIRPTAIIDDGDWESSGGDVWHDGNVGIGPGADNPSHPLEVTGDAYFYNDINVAGSSVLDLLYVYDNFALYNGGMSIIDGNLSLHSGELWTGKICPYGVLEITDNVTPFVAVDQYNSRVGIMTSTPGCALDVAGTTRCTGFRLETGATNGHVLTSDASGNATWQAAYDPTLESGRFDSQDDYAVLVDCNGAQLRQNGSRSNYRIYAAVGDASVCYAYYMDGSQMSKATLTSGGYYDFTVPSGSAPYHAEVILSRPWAGGAVARVDIVSQNNRFGGIWHSSH